jgi:collagenase-like PrtC family protease
LDLTNLQLKSRVLADIEWIVEEVRPTSIVIADPRIAALVRSRYGPEVVGIRVSTIAGIKTVSALEPWLPLMIDGVVLHHDVGRAFARIEHIVGFLREQAPRAEVELLVNESCVHQCFARDAHYARLALASVDYKEGFQQNCNIPRLLDPSIILGARWIRPEDLDRYVGLGVRRFKIAGREMDETWLDRAVGSYLRGSHDGNLVELFTMTPPGLDAVASDIVFVDNRSLEGFLDGLPGDLQLERRYLQRLATHLWEQGALKVKDPDSRYEITAGRLRCTLPGRHLARLQALRVNSDLPFKRPVASRGIDTTEVRH